MKATLFLTLLFVSTMAFAKSPYDVCGNLFSSADKIHCLEVVKGKQFNPAAIDVCDGLFSSADKVNCLSAIADKDFLPQEMKICGDLFSSADKIACLTKVGSSTLCPTVQVSKTALENVLNLIAAGSYRAAYSTTSSLLDHFQACQ